ncbi:hypothetical protein [Oceanobacillus sp. CF4.6]|uniref:hypothetical protein n=1 Tax=Oceanobacillus sp. CF4.6 TaxID=3373080 RepID=UPI003EE6DC1F
MKQKNILGRILFYFGIAVIVLGFIQAILNAQMMQYDHNGIERMEFEWRYFLMSFIQHLISGVTIIALSEVIRLLNTLNYNFSTVRMASEDFQPVILEKGREEPHIDNWTLTESEKVKIHELYSDKAILEIIPSHKKGYCIVTLQDFNGPLKSFQKIVDINDVGAREVHDPVIKKQLLSFLDEK